MAYSFIIASSVIYILISILLNVNMDLNVKFGLFGTLRLLTGLVSTFYPIATVLGNNLETL